MNWERVWIIGNGPSNQQFNHSRLNGENVLVINRALFWFDGSAFFSLDRNFINKHKQDIIDFQGEKHLALPVPRPEIQGAVWYDWGHAGGLSQYPSTLNTGCNSGYAAINLCYLMGSREIHLVGYDMDPKHNSQYQFWLKSFDSMLPQLNERGIKVYNHNVNSFITAFERIT